MKEPKRLNTWLIIISVVVAFHLILLVYVKPSFFSFLLPSPRTASERIPAGAPPPDAILYVPLEFDDAEEEAPFAPVFEEFDAEETVEPTDRIRTPAPGDASDLDTDIGDIAGEVSRPLPPGPESDFVRIPPRPLQITWPDTRRLKRCLGRQIQVRIQVNEDGRILQVEPPTTSHPDECVRAALDCAGQIIFAPGRVNGRPLKMWTEIRIDFGKKNEP